MDTPKIYGTRICRQCKGICHEGSFRTSYGKRKAYFCGEQCLRYHETQKLREQLKKIGYRDWYDAEWDKGFWQEHLEYFEQVDVIAS